MKKQELEKYRELLLEKREEFNQKVLNLQASGRAVNEDPADLADAALNSYDKEFFFNRSNSERKTLILIDEAMNRLEKGRFGRCQACGVPVSSKRLEIVPWARHCVECQEKMEKGRIRN